MNKIETPDNDFNQNDVPYPTDKYIHHFLEEYAQTTPHATAIHYAKTTISYAQLNAKVNKLANYLIEQGIGPDSLVGIFMERTPDMMVAILGILKAGAAYLPINPLDPNKRIKYIVDHSGLTLVLSTSDFTPEKRFPMRIKFLNLDQAFDTSGGVLSQNSENNIDNERIFRSPEHIAYVIFTSGSTGLPKGVQVTHRGLLNYAHWTEKFCKLADTAGAIVSNPMTFDSMVTSIYPPLLCGKAVVLPSAENDIKNIYAALCDLKENYLYKVVSGQVPTLMDMLGEGHVDERAHIFVIGGDKLPFRVYQQWQDIFPNSFVIHHYGPTETVVGCCIFDTTRYQAEKTSHLPIGRPIYNVKLYLLDENMQPVAKGEYGELYIGGPGVARGYLKKPDLTAERFLPDPFSTELGARFYRTGDQVHCVEDGSIKFVGRIDNQVKVGGFRIEPGEIEAQLLAYFMVKDCLVLTREDKSGYYGLIAYIVLSEDRPGEMFDSEYPEMIKIHLRKNLPQHMIPSDFVILDIFPLTVNGKIDRKALPIPEGYI